MRTTKGQLDNAFIRYVKAAESVGFDVSGWCLSHGSKSQGQAYTIGHKQSWGTVLPGTSSGGGGHVGQTRTDAYIALTHMAKTLEDVVSMRKGESL